VGDEGTGSALLPPAGLSPSPDPVDDDGRAEATEEVQQLVNATWTVAARIGSFEPSVRDILQEAGISTKAFYRHFRSKDELLLMALEEGSTRIAAHLESKMAAFDEPLLRVSAWIDSFVRHSVAPPVSNRLPLTLGVLGVGRLANVYPAQFDHSRSLVIAPLEREIARAVAAGTAHSPSPVKDARIVFGYTMDAIRIQRANGTQPNAATIGQLVDFTYRALGATPPD
jgi:AcrR family transcriptional regulator